MPNFPYSEAEITGFLRRQVPALLAHLDPAQAPAWGQMSAQHMVEHLAGAVRLSMGRYSLPTPPAGPALHRMQAHLLADAPFPPGVRNPAMAAASAALLVALDEFFDHYARQPTATAVHPLFGALDFPKWRLFHFKHFNHHLVQFGLLPTSLLPRP